MRRDNARKRLPTFVAAIPFGRAAQPIEIADAIAYLCSKESSFISVVPVDGGANQCRNRPAPRPVAHRAARSVPHGHGTVDIAVSGPGRPGPNCISSRAPRPHSHTKPVHV
nr:SDR family oxidoreductase [Mycolicibacterium sp.]